MTTLRRAAENHLVLSELQRAKPKPEKQKKTKRVPVEKRRKRLEKQIEDIIKLIIFWRDGQVCVMGKIDGGRCGNGLMWSHVIAQKQSSWLRIDLGNVVCGCGNHNLLDFHGDKTKGPMGPLLFKCVFCALCGGQRRSCFRFAQVISGKHHEPERTDAKARQHGMHQPHGQVAERSTKGDGQRIGQLGHDVIDMMATGTRGRQYAGTGDRRAVITEH